MRAEFFTTTQPVIKSPLTFLLQDSKCLVVNLFPNFFSS